MLAVADTGPLHYLVMIDAIDLLPRLFTTVLVPRVAVARTQGLVSIGILGLLDQAAAHGLIDFAAVAACLTATNFRYPLELLDALLAHYRTGDPGHG